MFLTLGDQETATKLKLMQVSSSKPSRKIKQPYIHTLTGFSYLTIFVKDVDLVMQNARKKGLKPYAIVHKPCLRVYPKMYVF